MNSHYKIFTDKLLNALQNAQEYIGIRKHIKENVFYEIDYIDNEDEYYEHGNADHALKHTDLKPICDSVLFALENNTPMPYLMINNCDAHNFLIGSLGNSQLLISFFEDIKSEDDKNLIYDNIFNGFGEKYIAQCLSSFKDNNKLQNIALLYLLNKCIKPDMNLEVYSHPYGNFIAILKEKISINSITREVILKGLESYYPRFLKYDQEKGNSYYSSDSPRKAIDSYLVNNENPSYWHLYNKYTSNGKELSNFKSTGNIFKAKDTIIESFDIVHNELLLLYPHVLESSKLTNMIDDVIKHVYSLPIQGLHRFGLLPRQNYNMQRHSYPLSTIWLELANLEYKDTVILQMQKILANVFDFYQANIDSKQPEHEKERLIKQILPTYILDSKIPENTHATSIKRQKI